PPSRGGSTADTAAPPRPRRPSVSGPPTRSRPVAGALLGAQAAGAIVVARHPAGTDAARRASLVIPAATGHEIGPADLDARREQLAAWRAAAEETAPAGRLWQQQAALTVWESSGDGDLLVLGSSSLVRDLEQLAGPTAARVIANRGLAGID